jgi:hypothetical protein
VNQLEIPRLVIEEDSYRQKVKELEEKKKEEEDERKWRDLVDRVKKETLLGKCHPGLKETLSMDPPQKEGKLG